MGKGPAMIVIVRHAEKPASRQFLQPALSRRREIFRPSFRRALQPKLMSFARHLRRDASSVSVLWGSVHAIETWADYFSKAKTLFQSFFMLITVHPFLIAIS